MNKTLIATITAIVLVLAFAITLVPQEKQATAQETTPFPSREKIISVTGTATTSVEPDLLRVQFGVETQEKTAKEALEANSSQMTAIVDAIKKLGITEDELSTSSLNIYPVYDSYEDKLTGRYTQELIGYRVSNILMVETNQLSLAADIIDSAVAAGANRVDSVYFTLSPEKQLEVNDSLLAQAVLNAKSKAEKALAPLDHKIIGVKAVSLSEFGMPPPIPYYDAVASYEGAAFKSSTPVFSSDQEVSTTANVIFVIGSN
ncbi:MAG: SIMPL domain-containing protein [Nitrososphaerota archaeon]